MSAGVQGTKLRALLRGRTPYVGSPFVDIRLTYKDTFDRHSPPV